MYKQEYCKAGEMFTGHLIMCSGLTSRMILIALHVLFD
jgi:hypothetical protein